MLKKSVVLLLVISIFLALGTAVYAAPSDATPGGNTAGTSAVTAPEQTPEEKAAEEARIAFNKMLLGVMSDKDAINTDFLYITVTRPDSATDSTYEKSYVISGIAKKSDVRVYLGKYNENTKKYEAFKNKDGKSYWDVAEGKAFSKEILLEKGANKIKIVAYNTADTSKLKQEDFQVNSFTISLLERSVTTVIKNTIDSTLNNITDGIKSLIKP